MGMESIYPKPLLKRVIVLGVKASIVANLLLWAVFVVMGLLEKDSNIPNEQANPYTVMVPLFLATMAVSLVPGLIGAATNAYVLYQLLTRDKLTRASSLASGLLIGFLAGFATIPGIYLISGDIGIVLRYQFAETVELALIVACVAAPAGGWHGWRLGKWLLKSQ